MKVLIDLDLMLTERGTKFSSISYSSPAKLVCVLNRSKLQQLHLEKQHLEETLKSLRARCSDMEDQCVQHDLVQQRMKARYVHESPNNTVRLCVSKLTQNVMKRFESNLAKEHPMLCNRHTHYGWKS